MATIEDLYKYFGILADAKEDAGKHVDTYLKIVECTKGGSKEKQLASQFITRFFKYFSKETGTVAIDAIFDLCEDDDVNIRKQAIKDLATICKDSQDHLHRIADILTQLLQTDDPHESLQVQNSLTSVFKLDQKSTLTEIFNQINTADLEEVRKRAIKFLVQKIPTIESEFLTKEIEEFLIKQVKQVLVDVDAEEFVLLIKLLSSLPSMSTLTGRQELVNIIVAQSELDKPFDVNDTERLMILLSCTQQALPLFSKNVHSTKLMLYYLDNLFPVFSKLNVDDNVKLEILKSFAEMSNYLPQIIENIQERLNNLFNLLLEYLPRPVENTAESNNDTKFNFSFVECLMHSFHQLGRHNQEYLTSEEQKERLKDFKIRLQYFATGTQNYIKELRNTIVLNDDSQENKVRKVALRVTTNIDVLIKDLFHNPPSYKSVITLSWKSDQKPLTSPGEPSVSYKRSLSNDKSDNRQKKPERDMYHPPSGKYSHANASSNTASNGDSNGHFNNFSNGSNGFKRRFNNGGRGGGARKY